MKLATYGEWAPSPDWLKIKNLAGAAVEREPEKIGGVDKQRRGFACYVTNAVLKYQMTRLRRAVSIIMIPPCTY